MIYTKIHQVMVRVERVLKDRQNPHHKYLYIGHDDVSLALRKAFVEVGIVQTVSIKNATRLEGGAFGMVVNVRWTDAEKPESFIEVESYGESSGEGKTGKFTPQPQQVGIALSYAVKCAQLKNFCLVGDDTPDVEAQHGPVETGRVVDAALPGWDLSGNGSDKDDPPADPYEQMIAAFAAVTTLKRFDEMMRKIAPQVQTIPIDMRKRIETAALTARKRLTSNEKEVEDMQ